MYCAKNITPEDIPAQAQSVNYLISDLTTSGYNMEEKIRKYRSLEILNDRTRTESISSGRNQPTPTITFKSVGTNAPNTH